MIDIVVGAGEVGSSIGKVLEKAKKFVLYDDPGKGMYAQPKDKVYCLHICFPYSENFVESAKEAIHKYKPELTIIHSTVDVGTTRLVGKDVVHSFVRGIHREGLENHMVHHTKHLGCTNEKVLNKATGYLVEIGFVPDPYIMPEITELGKLMDTTYYGVAIALTKFWKEVADHYEIPWESQAEINRAYNQGALFLGHPEWVRPELEPMPGPIGGHCVVPNAKILSKKFPHKLLDSIIEAK